MEADFAVDHDDEASYSVPCVASGAVGTTDCSLFDQQEWAIAKVRSGPDHGHDNTERTDSNAESNSHGTVQGTKDLTVFHVRLGLSPY